MYDNPDPGKEVQSPKKRPGPIQIFTVDPQSRTFPSECWDVPREKMTPTRLQVYFLFKEKSEWREEFVFLPQTKPRCWTLRTQTPFPPRCDRVGGTDHRVMGDSDDQDSHQSWPWVDPKSQELRIWRKVQKHLGVSWNRVPPFRMTLSVRLVTKLTKGIPISDKFARDAPTHSRVKSSYNGKRQLSCCDSSYVVESQQSERDGFHVSKRGSLCIDAGPLPPPYHSR